MGETQFAGVRHVALLSLLRAVNTATAVCSSRGCGVLTLGGMAVLRVSAAGWGAALRPTPARKGCCSSRVALGRSLGTLHDNHLIQRGKDHQTPMSAQTYRKQISTVQCTPCIYTGP